MLMLIMLRLLLRTAMRPIAFDVEGGRMLASRRCALISMSRNSVTNETGAS
jgi:hypothetical protein